MTQQNSKDCNAILSSWATGLHTD